MVTDENTAAERMIVETETSTAEPSENHGQPGPEMRRYLLTMLAVMSLMYFAPFFLVRSTLYDRVNPSFYARPLNYPFTVPVKDADVVLFGDSTALLGIDPSQMASALNIKVVNLVNTLSSLLVNDDLTLRRYLSTNRPPKLIVFYFAPWDFDYGHVDFSARPTYDGEELLLRQGTPQELLAFSRKRPMEAINFPLKFYSTAFDLAAHPISHRNQEAQLAATFGHIDNFGRKGLDASCTFDPIILESLRFDWVRSLGERYASPQTKILFYVAPVPSCTNVSAVLAEPYQELPAAPPRHVPPAFFVSPSLVVHPLPFAVPEFTRNLTEAVRPLLAPPETHGQPSPDNRDKRIP